MIVDAPIAGGDDEGLAIVDEAHVADEAGVEDSVDCFAILDTAMGFAPNSGAFGLEGRGHYFFSFGSRSMEAELMQYRRPVGLGPSSKTWPRWASHLEQRTSVRFM